jgi:hypothetical protein
MTKKNGRLSGLIKSVGGLRRNATIEVKQNVHLIARERGKIVARRDGHNIWVNLGREYLAGLIAYASFTPVTPERDDRIRYMGLGIGGTRQLALPVANAAPLVTAYPGTNAKTDTDPTVTILERPVRTSGSSDPYPGQGADVWVGQIQAPATHGTATEVTFKRLFSTLEISYSPFLTVPLSEVGLFTASANVNIFNNLLVAYDTFDTLSKTNAFELEIDWTVRF